jgi:starch synthase
MKGGIECANRVTTVSPSYAIEILDPWYSHGLDTILNQRRYKLCGILNGIDFHVYDPASPLLPAPFSAEDLSGKAVCRKAVLDAFGMQEDDRPVIAMIGRLTAQKGLDLVKQVIWNIQDLGARVIMLGTGDKEYEDFFSHVASVRPDAFAVRLAYDPALAKLMYAGSDLFLMPSKTEPCGLAQMMALRYGTLPIVRRTGGLNDSVKDCGDGMGCGFTFQNYDAYDMLDACRRAVELYRKPEDQKTVMRRAMACDFSWQTAADAYLALYTEIRDLW